MIIYMNLCKTKGVLGSWKLWFSYINKDKKTKNKIKIKISADFQFRAEEKKVTSRAEPSWKTFSLSCGSDWLEPARLVPTQWYNLKDKCYDNKQWNYFNLLPESCVPTTIHCIDKPIFFNVFYGWLKRTSWLQGQQES